MEPFPAYPSGKSRDEASRKMGSGKKFYHHAISEADFAFCRDKWPVHGGQLQLHRNKGDLQGFELHGEQRPRKCHGIQGVSTVGERILMLAVARQPVSTAIEADPEASSLLDVGGDGSRWRTLS